MTVEITTLKQPIDAMYLIHKALRGEADRMVELARSLETGCSLQAFKLAFTPRATAIMYRADEEVDTEMSKFVDESGKAAANYPVEPVKWAPLEKEDGEYTRLLKGVIDVMTVLEENIGATSVIPRTKQHLYGPVIAHRVAQENRLEAEEVMVIPLIRENLSAECQLKAVGTLFIDDGSDDQSWFIDWVYSELGPAEQAQPA